jgi:hypothetical protein
MLDAIQLEPAERRLRGRDIAPAPMEAREEPPWRRPLGMLQDKGIELSKRTLQVAAAQSRFSAGQARVTRLGFSALGRGYGDGILVAKFNQMRNRRLIPSRRRVVRWRRHAMPSLRHGRNETTPAALEQTPTDDEHSAHGRH